MTAFDRRTGFGAVVLALVMAGSAAAQENLDSGKTPAELYAQDCAICHKSPRGLAQTGGILGVQAFLREHYTASREAAAAIAAYLDQANKGAPPSARPTKRTAKPKDKTNTGDTKPADKGTEPKDPKASEAAKPAEAPAAASAKPDKPEQADKPAEAKADDAKPAAKKPRAVAKPAAAKPDTEKKAD